MSRNAHATPRSRSASSTAQWHVPLLKTAAIKGCPISRLWRVLQGRIVDTRDGRSISSLSRLHRSLVKPHRRCAPPVISTSEYSFNDFVFAEMLMRPDTSCAAYRNCWPRWHPGNWSWFRLEVWSDFALNFRRVHPPTDQASFSPKPKFNFNINLSIINIILYFVKF
jgi:hypothetical protein